jgi:hypothetical protein
MFENKRIEQPKFQYKLEFDIKTNDDNIVTILEKIQKIIADEFNNSDLLAEVMPTLTILD